MSVFLFRNTLRIFLIFFKIKFQSNLKFIMVCKYEDCERQDYGNYGYCIFHCGKVHFTDEEIGEFEREFWKYFEKQDGDKNVTILNFEGFKFPKNFSFEGKRFKKAVNFSSTEFVGDVNFKGTEFAAKAKFLKATFTYKAIFTEAKFNGEANFRHTTFTNDDADFTGATFSTIIIFENVNFNHGAIFTRTIFNDESNFRNARFYNSPSFLNETKFYGNTDFSNATVKNVSFKNVTFLNTAHFLNTKFSDGVDFEDVKFLKDVFFEKSIFSHEKEGSVIFKKVTFGENAHFNNVEFLNDIAFEQTKFILEAFFMEANFTKTKFVDVYFEKRVSFENARFSDTIIFKNTRFFGEAEFKNSEFKAIMGFKDKSIPEAIGSDNLYLGWAEAKTQYSYRFVLGKVGSDLWFEDVKFDKNAGFENTLFSGNASFFNVEFSSNANFKHTIFYNAVRFIGKNNNKVFPTKNTVADFSFSTFDNPERVEFVNVDLSKTSFLHCQGIEKFRFVDVEWARKTELIVFREKAIYDETVIYEGKHENYELVGEVYRKLRINYERNLRYADAGDFYVSEMEMKRKNAKLHGIKIGKEGIINIILRFLIRNFSLTAFYRYFSYYGETYLLPLFWILAIIFIFFPVLLSTDPLTSAQIVFQSTPDKLNEKVSDLVINLDGIYSSLKIGTITINSGWLVLIERIAGILFIALFVLALRRKFKKGGE